LRPRNEPMQNVEYSRLGHNENLPGNRRNIQAWMFVYRRPHEPDILQEGHDIRVCYGLRWSVEGGAGWSVLAAGAVCFLRLMRGSRTIT
jgi:hypothetical protein